jgi:hypothetical protein
MVRLLTLVLAVALVVPGLVLAKDSTSKDIVLASRTGHNGAPPIGKAENGLAIELCADSCDYFVARKMKAEPEVWDAVLLHQAYFDQSSSASSFRSKFSSHISKVMARYASKCSKFPQDASRASCIIKYLAGRNGIIYAIVRYTKGMRCEEPTNLLKPVSNPDKAKCAKA